MSDDLKPLTPREGVDRYLQLREPELEQSSMENTRHRMRVVLEWVDEYELENLNQLTGRDLAAFVAWRRGDVAPITLQKQLSTVRQALRFWEDIEAVEDGLAEKLHSPELPDGADARDVHLSPDRAEDMLSSLSRYHHGSREHALLALLWRTGMRRSAVRALDVDDVAPEDYAVEVRNRPETDTRLKNGDSGERDAFLGPRWYSVIDSYLDHPDRPSVTDDHGRRPLFTTEHGRPTGDTIYQWVTRLTRPCEYGECPHDRDPKTCEAVGADGYASRCPSSHSPHAIRRGAITHHLLEETPPETVSERMDVSLEVLYQHYDARTAREKMHVRKNSLPE